MDSPHTAPSPPEVPPKALVAHFLLQVQVGHIRTRDSEPVPLHFDSVTGSMTQYLWPVDPVTGERLAPSEFESHRQTHELLAPCCLCAYVDGKRYTEAQIGVAETVTQDITRSQSVLNGEIVAVCRERRCGYFLCLERFYPLRGLRSHVCQRRSVPLAPKDLAPAAVEVDESFRAGDGLFQVMTSAVIRGKRTSAFQVFKPQQVPKRAVVRELAKGMSEEQFWATFVQCLFCQAVIFRETFGANHVCDVKEPKRTRYTPYASPAKAENTTRSRVAASRLQRTYALAIIPGSPIRAVAASTEDGLGGGEHRNEDGEGGANETRAQDIDSANDADTVPEDVDLSSDFDLPTVSQLLGL